MKITLIFPPYDHVKFSENLSFIDNHFGVYPPLNLAYIASILEKEGHIVKIIDSNVLKLSKHETLKILKKFDSDIIAFMINTYLFRNTLIWIKYFKKHTNLPIICGGSNLLYYPKETLTYKEIDFGIIGSGRECLPNLLRAIEKNKNFSKIKGVCYKKKGKIFFNMPNSLHENLDKLPFPARHLLPNEKYYQLISKRKNFTIMITAVGCPYSCNFCPEGKIPFFQRSVKNTLEEIKECYNKYNIRVIDFFTNNFTLKRKWVIKFCNLLKSYNLDIDWSCRSRLDTIDEELLKNMADAGCKRIYYGIESCDRKILKNINKEIDPKKVKEIIDLTRKYGIKSSGFFMVGNPGETKKSLKKTIKFAKKLNLDFLHIMRLVPKPGTSLNEEYYKKTGKDYWREFILGNENEKQIPNIFCNLSDEEINYYLKKFYRDIYFSPNKIIKTLLKIKSFKSLRRYLVSGFQMIFE